MCDEVGLVKVRIFPNQKMHFYLFFGDWTTKSNFQNSVFMSLMALFYLVKSMPWIGLKIKNAYGDFKIPLETLKIGFKYLKLCNLFESLSAASREERPKTYFVLFLTS